MEPVKELTHILLELIEGRTHLSEEDKEILSESDCRELALAQQELLKTYNLTTETIWQTWNKNKGKPSQVYFNIDGAVEFL